jgi:hypothetical protein
MPKYPLKYTVPSALSTLCYFVDLNLIETTQSNSVPSAFIIIIVITSDSIRLGRLTREVLNLV